MAEALRLDILIDADGQARRAIEEFRGMLLRTGSDAESAAKQVDKFEQEYLAAATAARKATEAQEKATTQTKAAGQAAEGAAASKGKQAGATDALTSAVKRYIAPAAIGVAVVKTLQWADNLVNLSKSTGISITSLQKFEQIGKGAGVSVDTLARASMTLSDRLVSGDKSTVAAVQKLGLNMDKLRASSPDEAMLAFGRALSSVERPQDRINLGTDVMGRGFQTVIPLILEMGEKWESTAAKIDEKGVKSLADANNALGEVMSSGKGLLATVLVPFAPILSGISTVLTPLSSLLRDFLRDVTSPLRLESWKEWGNDLRDAARSLQFIAGIGPGIQSPLPGMPGAPSRWGMPSPLATPGDPMGGAAGQSWTFLNKFTGGRNGGAAGGGGATPYTANQWANISQVLGPANPMGMGGLGSFPGWAPLGAGFQNFQGVGFAPTVGMNAPGGGSFFGRNKGQLGLLAGGLAAQFLPGRAGQVAQGAMGMAGQGAGLGAMFGPHGAAIGAGIGALVGGVSSLFGGGGKAKKNAKNAEISQVFEQFSTKDFIALQKEADKFGISMEKALTAKTMKDFGAAVDEVNTKLQEMNAIQSEIDYLTAKTTVGFDEMNAVVKEFGLDVSKMGPAFQQASADKEIQKIVDALAIMEKGGADMNGVLDGMQDEIGKVVQDSLKFGTTIPENMKPWITKLMESGRLVDENGEKITDITNVKFGEVMESDMDKLVRKLDELISKLAGVRAGFDETRSSAEDLAGVDYGSPDGGNPSGNREAPGASRGGIMGAKGNLLYFKQGGFVPRGTDSVPAMLTPGEMVIARDQVKAMARGGRPSSITVNLHIAGYLDSPKVQRDLTRVVTEAIDRDVRMRRVG